MFKWLLLIVFPLVLLSLGLSGFKTKGGLVRVLIAAVWVILMVAIGPFWLAFFSWQWHGFGP